MLLESAGLTSKAIAKAPLLKLVVDPDIVYSHTFSGVRFTKVLPPLDEQKTRAVLSVVFAPPIFIEDAQILLVSPRAISKSIKRILLSVLLVVVENT